MHARGIKCTENFCTWGNQLSLYKTTFPLPLLVYCIAGDRGMAWSSLSTADQQNHTPFSPTTRYVTQHRKAHALEASIMSMTDAGMQAEAMFILQSIYDIRQRSTQAPPTPLLLHTLALLYHVAGDNRLAVDAQQKAIDLCKHDNDLYPSFQTFMDTLTKLISISP